MKHKHETCNLQFVKLLDLRIESLRKRLQIDIEGFADSIF